MGIRHWLCDLKLIVLSSNYAILDIHLFHVTECGISGLKKCTEPHPLATQPIIKLPHLGEAYNLAWGPGPLMALWLKNYTDDGYGNGLVYVIDWQKGFLLAVSSNC